MFRSGVTVVRLDIRMLDASGVPITDVRADEVVITEGNQTRPIVLFQRVSGAGASYLESARRTVAADISTNQGAPQGQLYVLVFDQDHIRPGGEARVRAAADAFLRDRVGAHDRVALFGLPGPGPAQPFTANLASARTQLALVRGGLERRVLGSIAEMTVDEAYEIMRGNEKALLRFSTVNAAAAGTTASEAVLELARTAGENPEVLRRLIRENAQSIVAAADTESRQFLRALAGVLEGMRGIDGRKTLVLFSEGFHGDNVGRELEAVAAAAADTYTVVHALDLNQRIATSGAPGAISEDTSEIANRLEPLGSLAAETSGVLHKDAYARAGAAMAALAPDDGSYYLIGFEPAPHASGDSAYRRVKVTTSRPGARVHARTGYAGGTAPRDAKRAIDTALAAPFTQQGLKVEYTTYVGQSGVPGVQRVALALRAELPVRRAPGGEVDRADVVFVVRDSRTGRIAASGADAIPLPETPSAGGSTGAAPWRVAFDLPAGDYIMRCIVREPGGIAGSADRRFTVRALGGQQIAATDLVVLDDRETFPLRATLYTGSALTGTLRLFGPTAAAVADATASLALSPANGEETPRAGRISAGRLGPATVTERGAFRDVSFHLPLATLEAGVYLARATVRVGTTEVADVTRTVEVVAGAPPPAPAPAAPRARDVLEGDIAQKLVIDTIAAATAHPAAIDAARRRDWAAVLRAVEHTVAGDGAALRLRGIAALGTEAYGAAAEALGAAFRLTPADGSLAFVLGWARVGAGDRPGAITAFRNAALLTPGLIAPHIALAETYLSGGHTDLALQAVDAGLRAVPASTELVQLKRRIVK